jgi:hypothetical protein
MLSNFAGNTVHTLNPKTLFFELGSGAMSRGHGIEMEKIRQLSRKVWSAWVSAANKEGTA